MIEATDASKCDERHVKNKPKSLHKKKGARQIMSMQGMKTWKLGLFFVISLMLVAGMFADTATAQRGTVSIRPVSGDSGEVLDTVTVIYTVKTGIPGTQDFTPDTTDDTPTNITDAIIIALPSGWAAATGNFGDTSTPARSTPVQRQGVWYSKTTANRTAGSSYIEVEARFAAAVDTTRTAPTFGFTTGGQVTVTVTGSTNADNQIGATSAGDRIIVTYHNVKGFTP